MTVSFSSQSAEHCGQLVGSVVSVGSMVETRGSDRERSSPPRGSRAGRPRTRSRDATAEHSEEHQAEDSGASEQSQMIRRLSEELSHMQEERQQAREERQ